MIERIFRPLTEKVKKWRQASKEHSAELSAVDQLHIHVLKVIQEHGTEREDDGTTHIDLVIPTLGIALTVTPWNIEGLMEYEQRNAELWYTHLGITLQFPKEIGDSNNVDFIASEVDPYNDQIHYIHDSTRGTGYVFDEKHSTEPQKEEALHRYHALLESEVLPRLMTFQESTPTPSQTDDRST